jgi:hypothetical protein
LRCYYFNQIINKLPENLTHLCIGNNYKQKIYNLPITIEKIYINDIKCIDKIPFGCEILNKNGEIICI